MEENCTAVISEEGACVVEGISSGNKVTEIQDHMVGWEKQGIVVEPLSRCKLKNGRAMVGVPATKRTGPLGQIVLSGIDWDVSVPPALQKSARAVLQETVKTQDVVSHRSMVPAGAQGKPKLVCFWDRGKPASAGCIYSKWSSQGGRPCHQTDGSIIEGLPGGEELHRRHL